MQYRIYKSVDGWKARSHFPFGENQELEIRTSKRHAGIVAAYASVSRVKDGFKTFMVFSDYSKIVEQSGAKRITEDAVRAVHELALKRIDEIKADAEAFYAAKQGDAA
jgi:hypothetical protein